MAKSGKGRISLYLESSKDRHDDCQLDEDSLPSKRYDCAHVFGIRIGFSLLLFIFISLAIWMNAGLPQDPNQALGPSSCPENKRLYVRKEWRALTFEEQHSYLDGIKCLTAKSSKLDLNTSRYDDFTYAHLRLVEQTHRVALSMPWHRMFIWIWEQTLRQECGYKGYLPYWDWLINPVKLNLSSIWDTEHGFGGNGSALNGCVKGGPLQNILLNYTEDGYQPHCLKRNLAESEAFYGGESEAVEAIINNAKTYEQFRNELETGPHKHIHMGISGEMKHAWSTNDPLFFLHHAQLDRIWSIWQDRDPLRRHHDYGGKTYMSRKASTQDIVSTFGLRNNVTVLEVLDIRAGPFCYGYSSAI